MNKKTILVLNTLYWPYKIGGAECSVQILVEGLRAQGHDVRVISTTEKSSVNNLNKRDSETSFNYGNIYWPFDGNEHGIYRLGYHLIDSYNLLGFYRVYKALKIVKPDVLITNNLQGFSSFSWLAALINSTPIIHIIRDYALLSVDPSREKTKKIPFQVFDFFMRWHYRYLLKKVHKVIGISQFILNEHQRSVNMSKNQCDVLYNPVVCPEISASSNHKGKPIVGYIGRVSEEKGIAWLLNSLVQQDTEFSLNVIVAGEGPILSQLKSEYAGQVTFLGKVEPKEFFS
ncbi:hypothetical protein C427_1639 [Paraglaciecola psychrophila 170]|uniref:Glycosyltransferase subfamily 4-like N-terminal domain-containing protein n=2 Tax=Paraglaciecola TaxID=1621534 RepID=M4RMD0_9ALTE|nr:glycosyltransferase [Paraglaciecola psychrophila]AGH43748.1 hypothetical protein C427_1639 [Paraglaciecola psychrophila 170]